VLETCACHEVLRHGVCEERKTSFVEPRAALVAFFYACVDNVQSGILCLTKSYDKYDMGWYVGQNFLMYVGKTGGVTKSGVAKSHREVTFLSFSYIVFNTHCNLSKYIKIQFNSIT